MPAPSASLATLRPDLAASFTQYDLAMAQKGFIGSRIYTPIDVPTQAGNFGIIPIEQLLIARDTARAPGSGYNRQNYKFTTSTYATKENGAEEVVDDRERNMYANYFAAEQVSALRARDVVLRNYEIRVVANLNSTSVFTNNSAVTTSWKTVASSDPVKDVITAKKAVYANSGLIANKMVVGWNVFQDLTNTTSIKDRIKYSGIDDPKNITVNMLAGLFGVDELIVAGAQKNTADEGQSVSLSQLWDDNYVFLGRVEDGPDFKAPCVGRTFHWSADGSSMAGTVESYRDERVRGDVIRVRMDTDEKTLYAAAGYLLTGAYA